MNSQMGTELALKVEEFLALNPVDERASDVFRKAPAEVVEKVLLRGDLSSARNPSAALLARVKDATRGGGSGFGGGFGGGFSSNGASPDDVEAFIAENPVDERAAGDLRVLSPDLQAKVMSRGTLNGARNPSAALLARIKDVRTGKGDSWVKHGGNDSADDSWDSWGGKGDSWGGKGNSWGGKGDSWGGKGDSWGGMDGWGKGDSWKGGGKLGMDAWDGWGGKGFGKMMMMKGGKMMGKGFDGWGCGGKLGPPGPYGQGSVYGTDWSPGAATKKKQASTSWSAPSAPSVMPQVSQLTIEADSFLVQNGFPAEGIAVAHDKAASTVLQEGNYVLQEMVPNYKEAVQFKHDEDWKDFPEIVAALQQTGVEMNCYCVAIYEENRTWAVGLASGWKGREAAAKLALGMALVPCFSDSARILSSYPDFAKCCEGKVEQPADVAPKRMISLPTQPTGGPAPTVHFLTLPPVSQLAMQGLPENGVAVCHDKSFSVFSEGTNILYDLIGDIAGIKYHDDPDWNKFPEVGQALKDAGAEDNCYMVATCEEHGAWAVGVAGGKKGRESAARVAMGMALAPGSSKMEVILRNYPEFAKTCEAVGLGAMMPVSGEMSGEMS